ncbi:hypothetical protein TRICI_005519 [Trichomonascus ciferrii]|uniref:54S ribosomal protein L20, mitochondrial n=1 Tax=Trichomonascus ciferrii TaxID=44093 RepID=A0A642UWP8_9ASCO|nr:hypothetical protein TRICI_005519 [Trichomonascus ciferrii]
MISRTTGVRSSLHSIKGVRFASNKAKPLNKARKEIPTRFPTQFNPVRSASNPRIQLPKGLVYNPAPAAPTPYDTPAAFLPENDKRQIRKDAQPYDDVKYMPPLTPRQRKQYNLTEEDMIEIQRLRKEDPEKWTRKALAEKFNCSEFFISIASTPHPDRQKEMDRRLDVIKSLWNESRYRARRDRERRKQLWLRDAQ